MKSRSTRSLSPVYFLILGIAWTVGLFTILYMEVKQESTQARELSLHYAQAFFQSIVTTRAWNAAHGGVYVPITDATRPNPYLDIPDRDMTTTEGRKLTLINPAFMTRQIAEIAAQKNQVRFHITSLNPVRPGNRPDVWEAASLRMFRKNIREKAEFIDSDSGPRLFRYMAPLWTTKACLKCHAKDGYKVGDLRGGISVSIDSDSIIDSTNRQIKHLIVSHLVIWALVLVGIYVSFLRLRKDSDERENLIDELQVALNDVKTLSGLVPICASCKKIRDDSGYWEQIEYYIERHSNAQFSHGVCPECAEKLYGKQEWYQKHKKK